jgi:hypothetical protein
VLVEAFVSRLKGRVGAECLQLGTKVLDPELTKVPPVYDAFLRGHIAFELAQKHQTLRRCAVDK